MLSTLVAITLQLSVMSNMKEKFSALDLVVRGVITSSYGFRSDPINKKASFHSGIDIAAPLGRAIRSVGSGRVIFSGPYKGYGILVSVEHSSGLTSHYAHCWGTKVKVGDVIKKGALLGFVGVSGKTTGAHLHFEIRYKGAPVNPLWLNVS